ncbi:hypothetical protein KFL_000710130 [Klebsormidium nitens]|uniref:Uncharacterized protein n=1 Tax=Klebsormidium nitens TaxID=105231 RepID=A0A1Y1HZ20_KLENI|nr:hypothetical protein KFL_000710130 [Klebsormidium nitens]|eukprot:GAQ81108.1 hypothetical protein KFL_000710130 [Klebsormidium nitens]
MGQDLYALDFDGVLCDSCGESSLSAWKAAAIQWPELFADVGEGVKEKVLADMRTVRPVVETGYENILLVRLLLEMTQPSSNASKVVSELSIAALLTGWEHEVKPVAMAEWGVEKEPLVELFGRVRDDWMDHDLHTWIAANRFYPGVSDALKFASSKLYIVTTKQTRFALALLKELAGVTFPEDHIYGLGTGPKVEVLKKLQERHKGARLHFVEDRLATLKNVIKDPALNDWNLYLGDWGYNTADERKEAESFDRIHIVKLDEFCAKLK